MTLQSLLLAVALPLAGVQAYIQAGANMYGCVTYAQSPTRPIQVDMQVGIGGTQCMDHSGSSGSFLVTTGGVTCYSIGYVENKPYDSGFDNCVVRDSLWGVSYKTNTSQTGSTSSYWSADYKGRTECEMELRGQSSGTYVCGSAAQCSTTTYTWGYDTTPTYYLIFNPQAASLSLVEEHDLPSRITITETLVSTETKYMMKSTGGLHDSEHEQIVWIA